MKSARNRYELCILCQTTFSISRWSDVTLAQVENPQFFVASFWFCRANATRKRQVVLFISVNTTKRRVLFPVSCTSSPQPVQRCLCETEALLGPTVTQAAPPALLSCLQLKASPLQPNNPTFSARSSSVSLASLFIDQPPALHNCASWIFTVTKLTRFRSINPNYNFP